MPDLNGKIDNSPSKVKDFNAYISVNTRKSLQKATEYGKHQLQPQTRLCWDAHAHVHKHNNMDKISYKTETKYT